jgi:hypothetical protein
MKQRNTTRKLLPLAIAANQQLFSQLCVGIAVSSLLLRPSIVSLSLGVGPGRGVRQWSNNNLVNTFVRRRSWLWRIFAPVFGRSHSQAIRGDGYSRARHVTTSPRRTATGEAGHCDEQGNTFQYRHDVHFRLARTSYDVTQSQLKLKAASHCC